MKNFGKLKHPQAAERLLARELLEITKIMRTETRRHFERLIAPALSSPTRLRIVLRWLGERLSEILDEAVLAELAARAIRRVHLFAFFLLRRQARAAGIAVNPLRSSPRLSRAMSRRLDETVKTIKTIPKVHHDRVKRAIERGVREGQSTAQIGKAIEKVGQISARRAKIIARDQTAKALSAITEAQQRDLGLKHFRWVTSNDERVRPAHRRLHGKVFSWSEGAPEHIEPAKFPGMAILCRCQALPLPEELAQAAKGQIPGR